MIIPHSYPHPRTCFNEGHCAALKETRPAEGCHLHRDAEVSITGGLNVSTDKASYLFGPLNQTKDSESQISAFRKCLTKPGIQWCRIQQCAMIVFCKYFLNPVKLLCTIHYIIHLNI